MTANPTVLGTCPECGHEWSRHVGRHCSARDTDASGNYDVCDCTRKTQAEPLRESQPSGVEDEGPLSVCAECGMPKCDCGFEGEGPTRAIWEFSAHLIDEICCEWGPPEYVATDDGEAWYWRFPGHDLPVGDNLSDILSFAASHLMK